VKEVEEDEVVEVVEEMEALAGRAGGAPFGRRWGSVGCLSGVGLDGVVYVCAWVGI